jgi:hypothetical protein
MKKEKKKVESEGLGDTVAKFTELLQIDKLAAVIAEALGEEDCGCTRRQEKLNELFPYKNKKSKKEE